MKTYLKMPLTIIMAAASLFVTHSDAAQRVRLNRGWVFNDSVAVTLPHDWSIRGAFSADAPAGNDGGYLPTGIGRYKRVLELDTVDIGERYELYFEGVYEKSQVFVNGQLAGGRPYGYSSFFVDITPLIRKGRNEIEVSVDNSAQKNCRWYSGSGIYRNVWFQRRPTLSFANHGTYVMTPIANEAHITTEIENPLHLKIPIVVAAEIDGTKASKRIKLKGEDKEIIDLTLRVPDAKMWSSDSPNLYNLRLNLIERGNVRDSVNLEFGFRTLAWDSRQGFLLNGKSVKLNGGCVHHDNGILGAAAYDKAEWRKAALMKEAGFNAVRTAHNAPSEMFLKACDHLGLLVIDEAFDGWRESKNRHDYHELFDEWADRDLEAMIRRDRNHPSVICWSIGNEIIERKSERAVSDAAHFVALCHRLDGTRPATQALASWDSDWEIYDPLAGGHDIIGYNYMIHKAESDHERVSERVMIQTESYPRDAFENWETVMTHPYIIGDFVWTAIDYLGESGIGRWYYEGDVPGEHYERNLYPWHAAYCGDIDLTGLRKPVSHRRMMLWNQDGPEQLYMAVREPDGMYGKVKTTLWGTWPTFESWNWSSHEHRPVAVEVYSHYPHVRLSLNGEMLAEKNIENGMAQFEVPYIPGELLVEGLNGGVVKESRSLHTTGDVAEVRLTADRERLVADGEDMAFITIELTDDSGNVVTDAFDGMEVQIEGPAELMALGNADIKDADSYVDARHRAWRGRALCVVRNTGEIGEFRVTVSADREGNKDKRIVATKKISVVRQ